MRRTLEGNKIVDHSDRAYRRCSNHIFDLIPGFTGLDKKHCKTRQETFIV